MHTILEKSKEHGMQERTVLIVDDEPANLGVISNYLASAGFGILIARDGESGLEKAQYARPDLILLDIMLPGIDGFETCRRLKADEDTRAIPVIFMTALTGVEDKVTGFEAGGVDYITKPFQREEILVRVNTHLTLNTMQKQLEQQNEQLQHANTALAREITERKHIENALRASEERMRTLINAMPDIVVFKDGEGCYLEANDFNLRFFGLENVDYRGKKDKELAEFTTFYRDAFQDWEYTDEIAWQRRAVTRGDEIIPRPDGSVRIFDVIKAPMFHPDGRRKGLVVVGRDVTERKQAAEALLQAHAELEQRVAERTAALSKANAQLAEEIEERKRIEKALRIAEEEKSLILNSTSELVVYYEPDLKVLWANHIAATSGGETSESMKGRYCYEIWHQRSEPCVGCPLVLARETGQPQEGEIDSFDGRKRFIRGYPIKNSAGQVVALAEFSLDITDRKRAEEALRQSEERYRCLFENSPISLWEEDFSHVKHYLDELRASGVTDFRTYFDQHPDAVVHCAELITVLDVNQATVTLSGARDKAELLADFTKVLATEALDVFREELITLAEGRQAFTSEEVHRTIHGEKRFISVNLSVAPGYEHSLGRVLVSEHDITERKRAEEELERRVADRTAELQASLTALKQAQTQLVETEKMAALGALVAGIAHEINTPVGNSVTAASYLDLRTRQMADHYTADTLTRSGLEEYVRIATESARIMLSNLDRAAHLIKSFKHVAVDLSTEEQRRFHLRDYLEDIMLSLRPQLKHTRHTITISCPAQLELTSYPGAFAQIFSNLIMNSLIHGFDEGTRGAITIDATLANASLTLIYRDNGNGIAAEHLPRIFEPFFTTKRTQNSTGLGLHIVYNVVTQQLHGAITCESAPGQGTTFTITIPGV